MFTTHISRLGRIAISAVLSLSLMAAYVPAAAAQANLEISNHRATPQTIDPSRGGFTNIEFTVSQDMDSVVVKILKRGQVVSQLFNGPKNAGTHRVRWNGFYNMGPNAGQQAAEDGANSNHTYQIRVEDNGQWALAGGAVRVNYAQVAANPGPAANPTPAANPAPAANPVPVFSPTPRTHVAASRTAVVSLTPANGVVDFGNVPLSRTRTERVSVRNLGNADLYFYLLDTPTGEFTSNVFAHNTFGSAIFVSPGQTYNFDVTFSSDQIGPHASNFTLRTNDANRRNIDVQLYANSTDSTSPSSNRADFLLNKANLNFNEVKVNTTASQSVTVSNVGSTTLEYRITQLPSNDFSLNIGTNQTYTLAPGQSNAIQVTFKPSFEGHQNSFVQFHTNDPHEVNAFLNLAGEGYKDVVVVDEPEDDDTTLLSLTVQPRRFNPYRQDAEFRFNLERDAYVTLNINTPNHQLLRRVVVKQLFRDGRHVVEWDGRDSYGRVAADDDYRYTFIAEPVRSGYTQDTKNGRVEVDTGLISGTLPPPPPVYGPVYGPIAFEGGCAGFADVSPNDPICAAVQFVKDRGIFLGDDVSNYRPGRTIRLNDKLNRAETAAVMLRAMNIPLMPYSRQTDGNLGFRDLDTAQWYMSPFKTAIKTAIQQRVETSTGRGIVRIMDGYPDQTMKPFRGTKRSELYKIFVEAALNSPTISANFTLNRYPNASAFIDTPITTDTAWYLPYADWAVRYLNNTLFSQKYFGSRNVFSRTSTFRPGEVPTRGEIIELIYTTEIRNLVNFDERSSRAETVPVNNNSSVNVYQDYNNYNYYQPVRRSNDY